MFLEKLEIQGFKSFAHKNKLIFSGILDNQKRGLTAIVGPNGSGKSNIADAIRWVLGEQSLKNLRGKKSEDVIFSGSDKKSQLSFAEVSLYLNNSDVTSAKNEEPEVIENENDLERLMITCSEICLTRRLYRSGESEYLINNSRVRLADIQMLLAKANFGQKTYSVIGQGMVENFLTASAADRKDFFDEATGVKQFQIKRDSSLNKLEGSYENLRQVNMLLLEIKPRLKSLTRQVEKLHKRDSVASTLRQDQKLYYGYLWQEISHKLNESNKAFLESERHKIDKEKKLSKLNEDLEKIRSTDNFQEISALRPKIKELEDHKNNYLRTLAKLQAEFELQLDAQGQFDVSWLKNKRTELAAGLDSLKIEITSLDERLAHNEETLWQTKLQTITDQLAKAATINQKIDQLQNDKDQSLKQLSRLEAIIEANLEIRGQFDVSWLNNKQEELKRELTTLTQELQASQKKIATSNQEKLNNNLQSLQEKLHSLNQEMTLINNHLRHESQSQDYHQKISRFIDDFLKKLEAAEKENDLPKIKKLIAAAKDDFQNKIHGLIDGHNGQELQKITKIQDEIIALSEEKQTAITLLSEERLRLESLKEKLKMLSDRHGQLEKELADITDKLAKAQNKFDAGQLEKEKQPLIKKITALEQEIETLNKKSATSSLEFQKQEITNKINDCRLQSYQLNEKRQLILTRQVDLEREIQDLDNKLSKSQLKFNGAALEKEITETNNAISTLNQKIGDLENRLAILNTAKEEEKGQMFQCQQNIQTLQKEINDIMAYLSAQQIEAARQETKLEDLENNIRNDELDLSEIKNCPPSVNIPDLNLLQKNINNNKNQLEAIGGIDPEAEKEYQETKERYDFLSQQTNDLSQTIKSLEEIIRELDENIKTRFDAEFKIISEKFNEYFKILFNGGSAKIFKLTPEDETINEQKANSNIIASNLNGLSPEELRAKQEVDDQLNRLKILKHRGNIGFSGIDIQATPPGKKIQVVTMLSGGERALTAIALICAIISANPSPFVTLDEVDAALDEANSERLAKILDDLSNKTQFIIITHNRACMRRASILYGVTMEPDGVSRLLSVKLDELKK